MTDAEKLQALEASYALERAWQEVMQMWTWLDDRWDWLYINTYWTQEIRERSTPEVRQAIELLRD